MAEGRIASKSELAVEIRRLLLDHERTTGRRLKRSSLARSAGVSASSLYAYLNGTTLPPADVLDRLLTELDAPAARHRRLATARDDLELTSTTQPTPRQLPLDTSRFTGRAAAMAELSAALAPGSAQPPSTVVTICGLGGIGKTSLAVHWAHRNAGAFPDGQLYADLRGFDPARQPVPPDTVMRGFLDALGVPPDELPVDPDAQAALYRSTLAGRRMVIVLDNVRDAAHAAPLVPGTPTCRVLVTSRDHLNGLVVTHGARPLVLGTLDRDEARDLLVRHLGSERTAAQPDAVDELVATCAGLPLAVAIVAARAASNAEVSLSDLAAELRTATGRLDGLDVDAGPASLPAVLSSSYRTLDDAGARLLRLLGIAPGPDISTAAAIALAGRDCGEVTAALRALEKSSLVRQHAIDRYAMHDLVRLYAADRAAHDEQADSRTAALRRLADHYTHTAFAGDRLLAPLRRTIPIDPPVPGSVPVPLADADAASEWFAAEHDNLMAVQRLAVEHGWHGPAWQLAWATDNFHYRRGRVHDHVAAWRCGLDAANRAGDTASQILAYRRLGAVSGRAGAEEEALECLRLGLDLAARAGDTENEAAIHQDLAVAWGQRGDDQLALDASIRALELYREVGNARCEAIALNNVGWFYARVGRHDLARTHCERALELHERHGDQENRAGTLDSLGYIASAADRHGDAVGYYRAALGAFRDLGHAYGQANALFGMGEAYAADGNTALARKSWAEALDLYRAQQRTADAERAERRLTMGDHRNTLLGSSGSGSR